MHKLYSKYGPACSHIPQRIPSLLSLLEVESLGIECVYLSWCLMNILSVGTVEVLLT